MLICEPEIGDTGFNEPKLLFGVEVHTSPRAGSGELPESGLPNSNLVDHLVAT